MYLSRKPVHCTALQMVPNEGTPENPGGSSFRFFKGALSLKKGKKLKNDRVNIFPGKQCTAQCCKWSLVKERPKMQVGHLSVFYLFKGALFSKKAKSLTNDRGYLFWGKRCIARRCNLEFGTTPQCCLKDRTP